MIAPLLLSCIPSPALLPGSLDHSPAAPPAASRHPVQVATSVRSVALFKNGLAVVRRSVELPGPGVFELGDVPEPVHGTFWIESLSPIEALVTERAVEVANDGRLERDVQEELAGCEVTLHLRAGELAALTGRVVRFEPEERPRRWSRAFETRASPYYGGLYGMPHLASEGHAGAPSPRRFLALDTDEGRAFVDLSMVGLVHVSGYPATRRETRAVLQLVARDAAGPLRVDVSYLAKGLSYAPDLRLDMADPDLLEVAQTAVLRNELEDLHEVEIQLISGFPSIAFSHVTSPLAASTSWASFFSQLGQELGSPYGRGMVAAQQVMSNVAPELLGDALGSIQASAEGVDLHYQPIGRRSLRVGETLTLRVAAAQAPYERIVEWRIPDTRDEWGIPASRRGGMVRDQPQDEGALDALRFASPFDFPLTTAPATIVSGDRFLGQRRSSWVNPGEETSIPITKALSIRTIALEHEAEAERELYEWGGSRFRKVRVAGELQIANHRKEPVQLVVRREFSGELEEAGEAPRTRLLERGVYSVNRRQELVWTLTLAPGEERRVEYAYKVLVHH